ncbi:MAG: hypothetical protein Kow00121_44560 [Elainellaceae cyanobacterium]
MAKVYHFWSVLFIGIIGSFQTQWSTALIGFAPLNPISSALAASIDRSVLVAQRNRVPPPRTSRSGLCVVSPGLLEDNFVIWSDRPVFVWSLDGDTSQVKMRQVRLMTDHPDPNYRQVLWETLLADNSQSVLYTGEPLQPDQKYSWDLIFQRQDTATGDWEEVALSFTFQIMDVAQQQQIASELEALSAQLQTTGTNTEAIAHRQADYFEEQGLWSDALQVLYSVQNPSPETVQRIQALVSQVCQ